MTEMDSATAMMDRMLGLNTKEKRKFLSIIERASVISEHIVNSDDDDEKRLATLNAIKEMDEDKKLTCVALSFVIIEVCDVIEKTLKEDEKNEYKIIG